MNSKLRDMSTETLKLIELTEDDQATIMIIKYGERCSYARPGKFQAVKSASIALQYNVF